MGPLIDVSPNRQTPSRIPTASFPAYNFGASDTNTPMKFVNEDRKTTEEIATDFNPYRRLPVFRSRKFCHTVPLNSSKIPLPVTPTGVVMDEKRHIIESSGSKASRRRVKQKSKSPLNETSLRPGDRALERGLSPISKADKPLPSPPVARVSYPSGPAHSSRSLIDATERPFHCPPGTAQEEAWRPISPQKPTRYSSQGHTRDSKRDILYPLSSLPAEVSAKTNRIIDKDEAVSAVFDTPAVQGLESDQLSPSSQTGISETSASGKDSSTISQDSVALENTSGAIKFSPERSSDKLVVDLESPYCNKCENEGDKKHSVFHPVCKPNGNTQCSALDMEVYHSKNQGIGESYTLRHKYLILPSGDLYRHLSSTSEAKAAELGGSLRIDIEASKYLSNGNTDGLFSGQETRHVSDDRNVVRLRSRRDATSDSQTSLDFSSPISASGESLLVSKRQRRLTSLQASRLSPTPAKLPGHSRRVSPHANLLLSPATSTKTGPPYSGNDTNQQASLSLKKETKSYPNVKSVPVNRASNTLSEPPKHSVQSVGAKVEAINLPYSTSTPEPVRSVVPVARTTIFSPRKTSKSQRHISLLTARDDFTKVTRYISSPEKNLMKRGSSSAETGRNAAANLNSKNSAITNANGGDVDANSSITKNARSPLKMRNAVTTIRGLFSKRHSVSGENNDRVHGDKTQENNNTSVSRKSNASSTHTSKSHRKPTKVSSYRQSSKNETRSPRQPRTPNSTFEPQIFNPYSFEKTKTLAKSFVEGVKMMPDGEAKNREKLSIQALMKTIESAKLAEIAYEKANMAAQEARFHNKQAQLALHTIFNRHAHRTPESNGKS